MRFRLRTLLSLLRLQFRLRQLLVWTAMFAIIITLFSAFQLDPRSMVASAIVLAAVGALATFGRNSHISIQVCLGSFAMAVSIVVAVKVEHAVTPKPVTLPEFIAQIRMGLIMLDVIVGLVLISTICFGWYCTWLLRRLHSRHFQGAKRITPRSVT